VLKLVKILFSSILWLREARFTLGSTYVIPAGFSFSKETSSPAFAFPLIHIKAAKTAAAIHSLNFQILAINHCFVFISFVSALFSAGFSLVFIL
jgi:hypothetical protein